MGSHLYSLLVGYPTVYRYLGNGLSATASAAAQAGTAAAGDSGGVGGGSGDVRGAAGARC